MTNDPTSAAYEALRQKIYKLLDSQIELSVNGGQQAVYSARYKTPAVTEQLLLLFEQAIAEAETRGREDTALKVIAQGYNEDCLFCGFKDKVADKARREANADGANGRDGEDK